MSKRLRIVVADDERDIRDYFQKVLPRLGHKVVALAKDGRELVEQCRATKPDLVITDIKMPNMNGIDAAAQIFRERATPAIFISAHHDAEIFKDSETPFKMGCLSKPIEQADLKAQIAFAQQWIEQSPSGCEQPADLAVGSDLERAP